MFFSCLSKKENRIHNKKDTGEEYTIWIFRLEGIFYITWSNLLHNLPGVGQRSREGDDLAKVTELHLQ